MRNVSSHVRIWRNRHRGCVGAMALLGMAAAGASQSAPDQVASGEAVPLSVVLMPAGLAPVEVEPLGRTKGAAPPAYSESVDQAQFDESEPFLGLAVGGLVEVEAVRATGAASSAVASDLDAPATPASTTSDGACADLELHVGAVTLLGNTTSALSISADQINSSSAVSGEFGAYAGGGGSSFTNLVVEIAGVPVPGIPSSPPVNTSIDLGAQGLAGASLHLNEELVEGDPTSGFTVTRNALRVSFDTVDLGIANLGAVDGEIVVGHSTASQLSDADRDGVIDAQDGDADGDGIPGSVERSLAGNGGDSDLDLVPDEFDLDSDNDGINDVREAGGVDADGDGMQDASGDGDPDEDRDGLVDSIDPDDAVAGGGAGQELPIPDTDGDGLRDFIDLDSDNDTIPDLYEAQPTVPDSDGDGLVDGLDHDGDGIALAADGADAEFGDAADTPPLDSDGDLVPNYLDPDSDDDGVTDIDSVGNGHLDADGDGAADLPITDIDGDGIPDGGDGDTGVIGGDPGLLTWAEFQASIGAPGLDGWGDDADGDTATNGHEFFAGTDPGDPDSAPELSLSRVDLSGALFFEVRAQRDPKALAFGEFEFSPEMVNWFEGEGRLEPIESTPEELAARAEAAIGPGAPRAFVRLRVTAP